VPSRYARPGLHGLEQVVLLRIGQVFGRERVVPAEDDQVVGSEIAIEGEDVV
jgi:hypothetical protein